MAYDRRRNGDSEIAAMRRESPSDLEAEQSVLGSMIIEAQAIDKAREIVRPEWFYASAHHVIFEAILILHERGDPVDILSLRLQLEQQDLLESVGGHTYLLQLTHAVPSAANVEHYARKVADLALMRRYIKTVKDLYAKALGDYDSVDDVIANGEQLIREVVDSRAETLGLSRGAIRAMDLPEHRNEPTLWFGLYPGKAHLFIGESGAGKSSALYNVAIHAARNEPLWSHVFGIHRPIRVLYIDPENAGTYREPDADRRNGGLCRMKMDRILGSGETAPPTLVFHDGEGFNLSLPGNRAALVRFIRRGIDGQPFDLVILDPLVMLFALEDENSNAEMGRVSAAIKQLSRESGAGIVAVHHTGKGSQGGVLAGRGASALAGSMDVVSTWRSRGPSEDEEDLEYRGEVRVSRNVCRWLIEKDRIGEYGRSALYLRMGAPTIDRFEPATANDWRMADKSKEELEAANKAQRAQDRILDFLKISPPGGVLREQIINFLAADDIGSTTAAYAIKMVVARGLVHVERRGRGGTAFFSLPSAKAEKAEKSEPESSAEPSLPHVDEFMAGMDRTEPASEREGGEVL